MIDPLILLAFFPAALALNLTPGADMIFCLGQGLRSGPWAAIAASGGVAVGGMIHMTLAGLGLGAIVTAVPWAFDAIRWVGVAYLLWLAWHAFRGEQDRPETPAKPPKAAFRSGLIVNLTNPKVILFVLAFVPQFVVPEAGPVLVQFLIFGAIIAVGGFIINAGVGIFAAGAGRKLARGSRMLGWITGSIFAALAVRLAIMEKT